MTQKRPLSFHVNQFSDKIRMLNDTNGKTLLLTAAEARCLHTDIFALLARIAELTDAKNKPVEPDVVSIELDGNKF
jgi:hypothetical protein